jgi:hypothetical protein
VGGHRAGEAKRRQELALRPAAEALSEAMGWMEPPAGKLQLRWIDARVITPFGQMGFFIEFLNLTGSLDAWIESCTLFYQHPDASSRRDLLGTWLLSILARSQWGRVATRAGEDRGREAGHEVRAIAQPYRDRADCENNFDELKNQWGWGGFTTEDLHRCQLTVRAVALAYNWWSLFVRLAHPKARLKSITSRPLSLSGIAKQAIAQRSISTVNEDIALIWRSHE